MTLSPYHPGVCNNSSVAGGGNYDGILSGLRWTLFFFKTHCFFISSLSPFFCLHLFACLKKLTGLLYVVMCRCEFMLPTSGLYPSPAKNEQKGKNNYNYKSGLPREQALLCVSGFCEVRGPISATRNPERGETGGEEAKSEKRRA